MTVATSEAVDLGLSSAGLKNDLAPDPAGTVTAAPGVARSAGPGAAPDATPTPDAAPDAAPTPGAAPGVTPSAAPGVMEQLALVIGAAGAGGLSDVSSEQALRVVE